MVSSLVGRYVFGSDHDVPPCGKVFRRFVEALSPLWSSLFFGLRMFVLVVDFNGSLEHHYDVFRRL
jgi:hypothetical protein